MKPNLEGIIEMIHHQIYMCVEWIEKNQIDQYKYMKIG